MSRDDPKPGRWILPLVVAGLIAFTYVFVNALPEAEVPASGTGDATGSTTTSSTTEAPSSTTSTTLNPDAAAFVDTTETIDRNVSDLATLAQQINDDWDSRDKEFGESRDALEDLETQTNTFATDVAALDVPNPAIDDWEAVTEGLAALRAAAADMIDGLVNAEGSQPRLDALEDYKAAADEISNALADVRDAVRDPAA
ncbi:MAG: hypothetical protein GY720_04785 [bacterium]|nr:hypothetical protein [bacterium]